MHLFSKHKIAFACQFGNISGLFNISCSLNSIKLIFYLQWILLCQLHTLTMKVKSVRAGEYTAPPAHGPMMREIWGMTPEAITFLWKQEHVQCQKYDTSCWWWVYGHDSRHLCGMLNRKECRASSFWAQKIVRCKTWHFKLIYMKRSAQKYINEIPGIYLHIQPEIPLLPGSELLQSRSARLPEPRPSWPGPWSDHRFKSGTSNEEMTKDKHTHTDANLLTADKHDV